MVQQMPTSKPQLPLLAKMLAIVATAHQTQFDKAGRPYFEHVHWVMKEVEKHYPDNEELLCIALGHDLFEDTSVTSTDLREHGFSERVISGILALTKMPGQSHEDYKVAVKANLDATKVKIEDLRHNSDLSRLKGITEKDRERQVKYLIFFKELMDHVHGVQPVS